MKRIILLLQLTIIATVLLGGCSNTATRTIPALGANTTAWEPAGSTAQPQQIALLLPLSGPNAPYANAIRNGFFTAYYHQKNETGNAPTIRVFDTAGADIKTVYQSAMAQGADFIVGPLDKADVLTLATDVQSSIPILALNTIPSSVTVKNNALYEFGLSPTDEAQQAALKAWQDQHRNVIILAPNSTWGQRLVNAFSAEWKQLGGNIIATQYYGDMASLSKNIANVLHIDAGLQDERALKNMFHENMRYIPARRQDFDSIFLVSSPTMARQIRPLLQFYFVNDIPIYATSEIYSAENNTTPDLDGIQFCDIPWTLAPTRLPSTTQTIQQRIQTLWPDTFTRYAKFYALGVDAFSLTGQLAQLQTYPQAGMPAATGTLYVTPQHYVYRQLMWAKIQNGQPQLLQ